MNTKDPFDSQRLRTALDLADTAEKIFEQRLRRQQPDLTETEIRERIAAWYSHRPGAINGDADAVPGQWPRH